MSLNIRIYGDPLLWKKSKKVEDVDKSTKSLINDMAKTMYENKFNDPVSTFGGHAWDSMWIVAEALENAGADKEGIRDYIETMKGFVGTGGVFNFSASDHCGLSPDAFEMLTVKNGKFVVIQD